MSVELEAARVYQARVRSHNVNEMASASRWEWWVIRGDEVLARTTSQEAALEALRVLEDSEHTEEETR